MGNRYEHAVAAVLSINFLFGTITFMELAYLLWSTIKDPHLLTDFEFCSVYLLRKRKRIRKLMKKIRKNISDDIFHLHDDFGEKRLSRRKLGEMYINVVIQEGRDSRESSPAFKRMFEGRHEIYEAHFQLPPDATTLKETSDLFKPKSASEKRPRTILVVGRPGKTVLTKRLFSQWQQQDVVSEFWHGKIVILIRFRAFNKGQTSLREMLRHSDGFNMSSADFNWIYEYICLFPSNAILIFDGLDELEENNESLFDEKPVNSHNDVTHVLVIFKQLVKGELLRGVTVLATSRPTGEKIYENLEFDREVEILGFHEEQIREYVKKFCGNDMQRGSDIHINNYMELDQGVTRAFKLVLHTR